MSSRVSTLHIVSRFHGRLDTVTGYARSSCRLFWLRLFGLGRAPTLAWTCPGHINPLASSDWSFCIWLRRFLRDRLSRLWVFLFPPFWFLCVVFSRQGVLTESFYTEEIDGNCMDNRHQDYCCHRHVIPPIYPLEFDYNYSLHTPRRTQTKRPSWPPTFVETLLSFPFVSQSVGFLSAHRWMVGF